MNDAIDHLDTFWKAITHDSCYAYKMVKRKIKLLRNDE
jgi:hypothetical protein